MSDVPTPGAPARALDQSAAPDHGAVAPGPAVPAVPAMPALTVTVPLLAQAPAAPHHGRATQMSASAVPSTLESPKDQRAVRSEAEQVEPVVSSTIDLVNGTKVRDDAAIREAQRGEALHDATPRASEDEQSEARHGGSRTLMSPIAGGPAASSEPKEPPEVELAHFAAGSPAFSPPYGSAGGAAFGPETSPPPPYGGGLGGPPAWAPGPPPFNGSDPRHATGGAPPNHAVARGAGQSAAPRSNTTMIALIVVGVVLFLVALGAAGSTIAVVLSRRAAHAARAGASGERVTAVPPGPAAAPAPPGAPVGRAMGATSARLSGLTARSLDKEAVRAAVAAVMPRVDGCFAATELEPPNHESVVYDLDVAASGVVTRAEPSSQTARCAKLDVCLSAALRAARMPRSPGGSPVKLSFAARIADLQPSR